MIHTSEDKVITFRLEQDVLPYRNSHSYSTGDYAYHADKFWKFVYVGSKYASVPSATNTDWELQTELPALDTTNIVGMVIALYFKGHRNTIVSQYSLDADPDFEVIDDTNASEGLYLIELPSSVTSGLKEGILLASIKILENITGYGDDGKFRTIADDVFIAEVNNPVTEFIDVPVL